MWVVVMLLVATLAGVGVYRLSLLDQPPWPWMTGRHAADAGAPRAARFDRASWEFARERSGAFLQRAAAAIRRLAPTGEAAVAVGDARTPSVPSAQAGPFAATALDEPAPISVPGSTVGTVPSRRPTADPVATTPAATPDVERAVPEAGPAVSDTELERWRNLSFDRPPIDEDDVLYVPVQRDVPPVRSRLLSVLGMIALVVVAGAILAVAVWQSTHLVAQAFHGVIGS
jgi:hypothetical protein